MRSPRLNGRGLESDALGEQASYSVSSPQSLSPRTQTLSMKSVSKVSAVGVAAKHRHPTGQSTSRSQYREQYCPRGSSKHSAPAIKKPRQLNESIHGEPMEPPKTCTPITNTVTSIRVPMRVHQNTGRTDFTKVPPVSERLIPNRNHCLA
jgi:hypothetical protein